MNVFKKIFNRQPIGNLKQFDAQDLKIEWIKGNNLRITFLTDSYMTRDDTITVNAPIVFNEITPGVVYDSGIKKEIEND